MIRILFIFITLCLVVGQGGRALAQSQLSGEKGRVLILDVSGSMNRSDFRTRPKRRWDQALLSLEEVLDQLRERTDVLPTAFVTFGDKFAWSSVSGKYATPKAYPPSGPLCSDVEVLSGFERVSRSYADDIMAHARNGSPSGMTPIPLALMTALSLLDPEFGGEIVLVSDMEEPNCLVPGQSLCSAIEAELKNFRSDGKLKVEFRVLATPQANLADSLAECGGTVTVTLPTLDPDHNKAVDDLLGGVAVDILLVAGGAQNLDPSGVDLVGFVISVDDETTGYQIAAGPPGRLSILPGRYRFTATAAGKSWTKTVTVTGPQQVVLEVDGGSIDLSALDGDGTPIRRLQAVDIRNDKGAVVWRGNNLALPTRLDLGTGRYRITGTAAGLAPASAEVPVQPAAVSSAVLRFGVPSQFKEVTVEVVIGKPTLDIERPFTPDVTLIAPDGTRTRLSAGISALTLDPGRYQVEVSARRPHLMAADIPSGAEPHHLRISVPPGWLSARVQNDEGVLELLDTGGKALFSFDGSLVEHSLPDGSYQLVLRRPDGSSSPTQSFEIVAGELVELTF